MLIKRPVVGDTVGDPFKDTSGPSLNILLKLMSVCSIGLLHLVLQYLQMLLQLTFLKEMR